MVDYLLEHINSTVEHPMSFEELISCLDSIASAAPHSLSRVHEQKGASYTINILLFYFIFIYFYFIFIFYIFLLLFFIFFYFYYFY